MLPDIYKKSIYDIDYVKLKKEGITCLIFDLDNTLGKVNQMSVPLKTRKLIKNLQKDFLVLIISNNFKTRIKPYLETLGVGGVSFALKPFNFSLIKIKRNYKLNKKEMVIIGDQLITDVLCGKSFNIKTVLVDPYGDNDYRITKLNRVFENFILNRYEKKGKFKRGVYYG